MMFGSAVVLIFTLLVARCDVSIGVGTDPIDLAVLKKLYDRAVQLAPAPSGNMKLDQGFVRHVILPSQHTQKNEQRGGSRLLEDDEKGDFSTESKDSDWLLLVDDTKNDADVPPDTSSLDGTTSRPIDEQLMNTMGWGKEHDALRKRIRSRLMEESFVHDVEIASNEGGYQDSIVQLGNGRNLQTLTFGCEDDLCWIIHYPVVGFVTVFVNCPASIGSPPDFTLCGFCQIEFLGDLENPDDDFICSSCSICSIGEPVSFDCSNRVGGVCSVTTCTACIGDPPTTPIQPTPKPNPPPTPSPVLPPTPKPVLPPTPAPIQPTPKPNPPPTPSPVLPPTPAPIQPTPSPVVQPTLKPVLPPTPAPVQPTLAPNSVSATPPVPPPSPNPKPPTPSPVDPPTLSPVTPAPTVFQTAGDSRVLLCEVTDFDVDGVTCLLWNYPGIGFGTGLVGCPADTEETGNFFHCAFCYTFVGDPFNGDDCSDCNLCANHGIGFDCSNLAEGDCTAFSCATGTCSSPPAPPPTPNPNPNLPTPPPGACFSGDSTVEVQGKGSVKMKYLALGDSVRVDADRYEPIYSFGHKNNESMFDFLSIITHDSHVVEVSKDHMIAMHGGGFVPASMVKIGDKIVPAAYHWGDAGTCVVSIRRVTRKGAYAPFTPSGKIVVGGIVASNYVAFQDSEYLWIGSIQTSLTFHWLAHSFNSVHRLVHSLGLTSHKGEAYNPQTGISIWVENPNEYATWLLQQHPVFIVMILVPIIVLFGVLTVAEVVMSPPGLLVFASVVLGAWYVRVVQWRGTKTKVTV